MAATHECDSCGAQLDVHHKETYDSVNTRVDVAYCEACDIRYEAKRDMLEVEVSGEGAAEALEARMEAVNEAVIDILQDAFSSDAAWATPIRECRFAEDVEAAAMAARTTAVETEFRSGLSNDRKYAILRFYGTCDTCGKTHIARETQTGLTPVAEVGFTMVDGPVELRCYCGAILDEVTGQIHKTWACEDCGRQYERRMIASPTDD